MKQEKTLDAISALKLAIQTLEECEDCMKGMLGCTDWGNPQRDDFPLNECSIAIATARAAIAATQQ